MKRFAVVTLLAASASWSAAQPAADPIQRQVAITIDDLPANCTCSADGWRSLTADLLEALQAHEVRAVGFVNEVKLYPKAWRRGEPQSPEGLTPEPARIALLEAWLDAGMELGNHSFSHPDLHETTLADYQSEVLSGEIVTRKLLAQRDLKPRYFRHPYLRTGRSLETKRAFETFLAAQEYEIAPVTIDNAEWIYARAYDVALDKEGGAGRAEAARVAQDYVDYMLQQTAYFESQSHKLLGRNLPHVLLLHANRLNAEALDPLLTALAERGYEFVSLETALEDPAYSRLDEYTGAAGISWIQRWAWAEGHRGEWFHGEPAVTPWIHELSGLGR